MRWIPIIVLAVLITVSIAANSHIKIESRDLAIVASKSSSPIPTPSPTPTRRDPADELTAEEAQDLLLGSTDADCDGIKNAVDNCPITFNPSQKDSNKDGVGDACENGSTRTFRADLRCDMDGDGIADQDDNCPVICNPDQKDANHNDIGDVCEGKPIEQIPLQPCRRKRTVKPFKSHLSSKKRVMINF